MAPMWNRFYLLCLLHLRRRRRLNRTEREFWERIIVAARTLEGAYYILFMGDSEKMRGNSLTTSE